MKLFLTIVSYIFHPLYIPFAGTLIYFVVTPRYSPLEMQSANILPIFILTVIIPVICFLILKNLGLVRSGLFPRMPERKYPLIISLLLLFMVLFKVIPDNYNIEIYFFFVGLIIANASSLLLVLVKYKSSLHLTGIGSLLMFLTALSIHFEINITLAISLCTLAAGLTATAGLYLRLYSRAELLVGFLLGFVSQLLMIQFWL